MRRHGKKLLDVFIQIVPTAVRDGVSNVGNGAGHKWQSARPATVACLILKLSQEIDLEIIKVMVVSRQLPASTILHLDLNDVPVFIIVEAISGNGGSDG